jgi:hypothetical protein
VEHLGRRCLALVAGAWLPLLVITAIEGTLSGDPAAFIHDIGVHIRFLVALPLLLIAEVAIERRFAKAVAYLPQAGVVDEESRAAYEDAIERAHRWRDALPVEAVLAFMAYALSWVELVALLEREPSSWIRADASGSPSVAGLVYLGLSAPLYRFLVLRWLWRLVIWSSVLVRLARAPLHLRATHPDQRGGIGVLCAAVTSFGWVVLAFGASLAGNYYRIVTLEHLSVNALWKETIAFAILAPALFAAPLFAFAWPLERTKRRYHEEYGATSQDFARRYDRQWVLAPTRAPIPLGSQETSTHADLGTSFRESLQTRTLPITREEIMFLFACAAIPMIAYLMTQIPLLDILARMKEVM